MSRMEESLSVICTCKNGNVSFAPFLRLLINPVRACCASIPVPPEDHRDLASENSFLDGQNANRRKEINKYPSRVIACLLHVGRVRAPVKSQEMLNLRKGRERDIFPDQNRTLLFPPSTAPPFAFLEKKFKRSSSFLLLL